MGCKNYFLSSFSTAYFNSARDNKGIDNISDYEVQQLKLKWFGVDNQSEEMKTDTFIPKISFVGLMTYQELVFALLMASILGYFTYLYISKSKVLNIRFKTFNIVIIAFELFMIVFLVYEIVTLDRTENALAQTYRDKIMMLQSSDELRQS